MKKLNLIICVFSLTIFFIGFGNIPANGQTTKWVDQAGGSDANDGNAEATAYASLQFAIDNSTSGTAATRSIINVKDGTYGITGQTNDVTCHGLSLPTAVIISNLDYLTIQAVPGHEPAVKPVTAVEANIVSISIENSDHLIIDNIDSDQTISQFDNWHVCNSNDLTVQNCRFEGGEDGIDFNTDLTTALIENNEFIDINTGSGDEVLDFTDGSYSDVTIQDNTFKNNYRQITLNEPSGKTISDFTIIRNLMDGTNSQEAIRLIGASNIVIENNVIMNNLQQGIYIDNGCSDITVRHNSFFNNDQEFGPNGEIRTKVTTSDILIKNNIIYGNGSNPAFETGATSLPGEDYNLVYNTTDIGSFIFGLNTITGLDPLFVNTFAGSEDLHLQSGSPAIEAGTDLGVADDIEKNPRPQPASSNPDLGAYEHPAIPVEVAIDIKPRHCPNKLKIKKKGKDDDDSESSDDDSSDDRKKKGDLKVAILGTQDFDVTTIDVSTLNINGVEPVKSKFKDVTAPSALEPCECEKLPKDTYEDLELKFNSQEIISILEPVLDGETRELTLTGNLLDGTAIVGIDCVLIKGKK